MKSELTFDEATHRYIMNGNVVPSVTQIIDSVFPFEGSGIVVQRAADFGKAVHKAIEIINNPKLNLDLSTVADSIKPYLDQYERFMRDHVTDEIFGETKFYSKNYGYAGKIDIVSDVVFVCEQKSHLGTPSFKTLNYFK